MSAYATDTTAEPGWTAACDCGWKRERYATRREADAAFAEHRANPSCRKYVGPVNHEAPVSQMLAVNAWEYRCTCGYTQGWFGSKVDAEVYRDRHMVMSHGQTMSPMELALRNERDAVQRQLDVAQAKVDAMALGAKPDNLTTPPPIVRELAQLKAEQKDLLANFTEMAKVVREFRAFDLAETRRKLDLIDQLHREGLLLPAEARAALRPPEDGPGIAALPTPSRDTSVAWLDEDLLCDDA